MIDGGQRGQAEHSLDELQDRGVLVERSLQVSGLGER